MKIKIFGSASGIPEKGKAQTCVGVESNDKMILLDIGEGAVSSMVANDVDFEKIEKVFISHTHADHFIGLPRFLQYLKWKKRTKPLEIYLPQKHIEAVEKFLPFLYIFRERFEFEYRFLQLPDGEFYALENLKVKLIPTGHLRKYRKYADVYGVETVSYGFLIDEISNDGTKTKRFFFTSDIYSVDEIVDYLDGVDLLLIECSHIEIEDIIENVSNFDIQRVVVTHISPEKDLTMMIDYARMKFDLNIELAYDGMKIEL
jgi:ribonuclease BN (tRNA processing enzyme)